MDYMDHVEVLEAMGFELAWGGRDWIGEYHSDEDLGSHRV